MMLFVVFAIATEPMMRYLTLAFGKLEGVLTGRKKADRRFAAPQ